MGDNADKKVEYLIVDTTAFIQNAPLQEIGKKIITCPEVVNEITSKRQLKRLVVLPYDLVLKEAFPENIRIITEFSKDTGDYPSLSATDIKVMALTYQLEKEQVGTNHLRTKPIWSKSVVTTANSLPDMKLDVAGFYLPGKTKKLGDRSEECTDEQESDEQSEEEKLDEDLVKVLQSLKFSDGTPENNDDGSDDLLSPVRDSDSENSDEDADDDESGWITPSNINIAKSQVNSELMEEKHVKVACMTTDFAMQNVLKQMNLNVAALDGRLIKQLRTYLLRCYTCFKTTSIMTKKFCPKCGNNTLKKVSASLDENGKLQIHINTKRPLTARGKKFSLPKIKGGKHPNNPILVEDQPMPQNRSSRLARTKNNPLNDDYIVGYSPFVMRDVNSRSALLCIRPEQEMKHWMQKNPNEARRRRK